MSEIDLTISIVNWNVKELLEKCLESIYKYAGDIKLEVVVIDNASRDGSANMVKQKFPQAALIENKKNIGYGCAHNQSLPLAKGRYILFLNPDTENLPDTISRTMKFMDEHPEAGACKCRELAEKEDIESEEIVMTKKSRFLWLLVFRYIYKIFPRRAIMSLCADFMIKPLVRSRDREAPLELPDIESSFLFVRREALKNIGGFDPEIFFGGEGSKLTSGIRKRGWKLYYLPGVKIIHYGSMSCAKLSDAEAEEIEKDCERYLRLRNKGSARSANPLRLKFIKAARLLYKIFCQGSKNYYN